MEAVLLQLETLGSKCTIQAHNYGIEENVSRLFIGTQSTKGSPVDCQHANTFDWALDSSGPMAQTLTSFTIVRSNRAPSAPSRTARQVCGLCCAGGHRRRRRNARRRGPPRAVPAGGGSHQLRAPPCTCPGCWWPLRPALGPAAGGVSRARVCVCVCVCVCAGGKSVRARSIPACRPPAPLAPTAASPAPSRPAHVAECVAWCAHARPSRGCQASGSAVPLECAPSARAVLPTG